MKYTVHIRKTDLLKMNFLLLPRLAQSYIGLGFVIACAGFGGYKITEHGIAIWLIISVLTGTAIYIIFFIFFALIQSLTATAQRGVIGKTLYTLDEHFFTEETQGTQTKTRWKSIAGIYQFSNYLFIRINGCRIHLVPKREFTKPEDFELFCTTASSYIKTAKQTI